jgi:integrase
MIGDGLDYIRKDLSKGLWIYHNRDRGTIILKYPYDRDHRGWRKHKTETVCSFPLNQKQRKDVKERVLDLAKKRDQEFFDLDRFGIEPESRKARKATFEDIAIIYMKEKGIEVKTPPKPIRDCLKKFGNEVADDITPYEIEIFYTSLFKQKAILYSFHKDKFKTLSKTLSYGAVKERKAVMRNIYKLAKKKGLVERNPALEAEINKEEAKKLGKYKEPKQKAISYGEFLLIYKELTRIPETGRRPTGDLADMALVAFFTGMRAGEVAKLQSSILKLNDEYPYADLGREHVSRGLPRKVPLLPPVVEMLKRRRKVQYLYDDRVFRMKNIHNTWRRKVERARVTHPKGRIRFHDLRSSFITLMDEAKAEPIIRMKIVGHTTPKELKELGISKVHLDYIDPSPETLYKEIMKLYDYLYRVKKFKKIA